MTSQLSQMACAGGSVTVREALLPERGRPLVWPGVPAAPRRPGGGGGGERGGSLDARWARPGSCARVGDGIGAVLMVWCAVLILAALAG